MKRSEVLKLIQGLFELELDLYPKHNDSEIFAENLLCHLELMGMLPPFFHPFDTSLGEAQSYVENYKWEKE